MSAATNAATATMDVPVTCAGVLRQRDPATSSAGQVNMTPKAGCPPMNDQGPAPTLTPAVQHAIRAQISDALPPVRPLASVTAPVSYADYLARVTPPPLNYAAAIARPPPPSYYVPPPTHRVPLAPLPW
nr:uncharacterized protein LOC129385533 [Dermacentor andersoni]